MEVSYNFVYIFMAIVGVTFPSAESDLMSVLLKMFYNIYVNKEHLESDLTIKASYKIP